MANDTVKRRQVFCGACYCRQCICRVEFVGFFKLTPDDVRAWYG